MGGRVHGRETKGVRVLGRKGKWGGRMYWPGRACMGRGECMRGRESAWKGERVHGRESVWEKGCMEGRVYGTEGGGMEDRVQVREEAWG